MHRLAIAVLVVVVALPHSIAAVGTSPPTQFTDLGQARSWIEANKGFGVPQSAEFNLLGHHIFVAWNSPFSGPASNYAYAYRANPTDGTWSLLDYSFFPQPEYLSYAYVDGRASKLVYVSATGKVLKSVSLGEPRFK